MMTSCDNPAGPVVTFDPTSTPAVATATPAASGVTVTITIGGGDGTGIVTASPIGPNYPPGTVVTLTATADAGSCFGGWTASRETFGGKAICTVTVDASAKVGAEFDKACPTPTPTYCHSITAVDEDFVGNIYTFTCPSGATQFCDSVPIVATNATQAKAACEACNGSACGDAAGLGLGGHSWNGRLPGVPNAEMAIRSCIPRPPLELGVNSFFTPPGLVTSLPTAGVHPLRRTAGRRSAGPTKNLRCRWSDPAPSRQLVNSL